MNATYPWTFEPLASVYKPPRNGHEHGAAIHKTCPVHRRRASMELVQLGGRHNETYSRSAPVELGNIRTGTIRATNAQAAAPIGKLNLPKFHGPARNLSPTKNIRMNIGMVNATKADTAPMEKSAPTAVGPPKRSKVIKMPMMVLNQAALTGVFVCWLTRLIHHEQGKQPSRA